MVFYPSPIKVGIDAVASFGDGHTINVKWFQAEHTIASNKIAYHIYFSTVKENVFSEGVKFVSIDGYTEANIIDLTPGQVYFFSVRPVEYDPSIYDLENTLPVAYDNLRVYPQSLLREDITSTDLIIPLIDVDDFPNLGVIKVGVELIQYLSVDTVNKNLVLTNESQRGFSTTSPREHTVSGYDGYRNQDPTIVLFTIGESLLDDRIFMVQSRFEYPEYAFNLLDGYRQTTKDLLSTDLTASDESNVGFKMYDYAGYHRTDPVQLLNGTCVGSYIGGEMGCIDGYGNVNIVRGMGLQEHNNQRQEMLLSVTGRDAVLLKRMQTGIQCSCYTANREYQDDRCPICYGTKFVFGYDQYYNPRSSDGRIKVRIGPTSENLKMYEAGLESEFPIDVWTLTVPTIKTRDVIILFDQDDNEEFRYEVADVTRNNTIIGLQGGQRFKAIRIRKFDPAYQIRAFRNTAKFPSKLNTSIGFVPGIAPHVHQIVINEDIVSITQINQTTAVAQAHNHPIVNGVVQEILGHTHTIII